MAISFKNAEVVVAESDNTPTIPDSDEILMSVPSQSSHFGDLAVAKLYGHLADKPIEDLSSAQSLDAIMDFTLMRKLELAERFREDGVTTDPKRAEAYVLALTSLEDNVLKRRKLQQDESKGESDSALSNALLSVLKNVTPDVGRLEKPMDLALPDLPNNDFDFTEGELKIGLDDRSNER